MAHSGSVFKSVCEDILEPRGVKVGGYKDDIFDNLSEKEREDLSCQICFMVAKDTHSCTNKHTFCGSCIYAWSMTSEGNTDRCPVCRVRGAYCSDDILISRIDSLAIKCLKCKWKGQVGDYRAHSHGVDDVGIDPKLAELPGIWSASGDPVFPDLGTNETLDETVEGSRRRHQRRYLDTQLDLIEGQARLAFLLDVFEEDLSRHRHNLDTLVQLQTRYNAEQFNEVMRLESELGQITANLLTLIDRATSDVDTMTNRLRNGGSERSPTGARSTAANSLSSTISRLRDGRSDLSSVPVYPLRRRTEPQYQVPTSPVEEPREPVRRARFFRVSSRLAADEISTNTRAPTQTDSSISTGAPSSTDPVTSPRRRRLLNRRSEMENSSSNSIDNSSAHQRITPSLVTLSNRETVNPFSITYPPLSSQTQNDETTTTLSSLTTGIRMQHGRAHNFIRQQANNSSTVSQSTTTTTPVLSSRVTESLTMSRPSSGRGAVLTPHPPPPRVSSNSSVTNNRIGEPNRPSIGAVGNNTRSTPNPYTITWPPASSGSAPYHPQTSPSRRAGRQE